VRILHWAKPLRVLADADGSVHAIALERTRLDDSRLVGTGEVLTLQTDMVFKAIGQTFVPAPLDGAAVAIRLEGGRIAVDEERRTSMSGVWAGGDCVAGGEDLTVAAAQDGKLAAESIHHALMG
jgi:dihydropyrimidine dehydrogenase (NAD+) subunit PreT